MDTQDTQPKKKKSKMDTFLAAVGIILIIGTIAGGNLKYITDWSTPELAGHNAFSIIAIFGGGFLAYQGLKK